MVLHNPNAGYDRQSTDPPVDAAVKLTLEHSADATLLLHCRTGPQVPTIVYANAQAQQLTGYSYFELVGSPATIFAGPETDTVTFLSIAQQLQPGISAECRLLQYRKDGRASWIHITNRLFGKHPDGGWISIVVARDVDAEVRLQILVDMCPDMISRHDDRGTFLTASQACQALLGYAPEELLGRRSGEFMHPDDARALGPFSKTPDVNDFRYRMLCADGTYKWVESRSWIVRNPSDPSDVYEVHALTRALTDERKSELELQDSLARYRLLFDANPSPMWIYDPKTYSILAVNRQAVTYYGYSHQEFALMTLVDMRPPQDVGAMLEHMADRTAITHDHGEWRHVKKDGSTVDVQVVSSIITWEGKSARVAVLRDVTAEKRARVDLKGYREKLERGEAALASAQSVAHLGSWDYNVKQNEVLWTDELYRIYGLSRDEYPPIPGTLWKFDHPDDVANVSRQYEEAFAAHKPYSIVHRLKRKDGSIRWVHEIGEFEFDENNVCVREVGTIQDVTERKIAEDELAFLAHFDTLTGLPNRVLLQDRLQLAIAKAKRDGTLVAVGFLDIDQFKQVNDSLGHSFGDLLLKEVANRLSGGLRESDTVCRYSGDEFIIILNGLSSPAEITGVVQRMMETLALPFRLGEKEYQTSASIGISVHPGDGNDLETLIKHADVAMYRAKSEGRAAMRFYSPDMQQAVNRRLALESELHAAIERKELGLYYQPIVELATKRIVGAEALLRWEHPDGIRLPAQFISIAEETGMIVPIGKWVIEQACAHAGGWRTLSGYAIPVSVNVSPRQFRQPDIIDHMSNALREAGVEADLLRVEITESLLMEPERALEVTSRLESLGIKLVLDDFGTGFSSLARVGSLPFSELKIDRTFVAQIEHDEHARTITRTIVALANGLNLGIVAEGIETDGQLAILRQLGCTIGQGYYFYKPMPEEQFRALLVNAGHEAAKSRRRLASTCSSARGRAPLR